MNITKLFIMSILVLAVFCLINVNTSKAQFEKGNLYPIDYKGVHKGDYFIIMGILINNSTDTLNYVKVNCKLYDQNKQFIGTYFTYGDQLTLKPNETTTFKGIISDNDVFTTVDDIKYFELSTNGKVVDNNTSLFE